MQNTQSLHVGKVGEIFKIRCEFLWVAWERHAKYAVNSCEWCGRNKQNTVNSCVWRGRNIQNDRPAMSVGLSVSLVLSLSVSSFFASLRVSVSMLRRQELCRSLARLKAAPLSSELFINISIQQKKLIWCWSLCMLISMYVCWVFDFLLLLLLLLLLVSCF